VRAVSRGGSAAADEDDDDDAGAPDGRSRASRPASARRSESWICSRRFLSAARRSLRRNFSCSELLFF